MGLSRYIECLVLTCLGWAPLLAVVTYKHACSKPCYYIHHVWTEKLPATTAAKLQLKNSSFLSRSPALISVENGGNFSALHPQGTWWGLMQTYPPILDSIWSASDTKEFPNPAHVNELVCETDNVRKQIENHPTEGYTITVYLFALVMWTLMKLAHDWALLAGVAEDFTLLIGVLSWVFQLLASCAAFSWAAAVTDVYVSRVPERNGACYYQLVPVATLTALGAALLLLYLTHVKMNNLVLSLAHGDYLHCKISNVPYRAAQGTAASHLLLAKGVREDSDVLPLPASHQQLPFRNRKRLATFVRSLFHVYWFLLFGFIIPLASGNIFHRVTEMAVSHEWSLGPMVFAKLATLTAASTPVIGSVSAAWMFFTVIQEVFTEWNSLRAIEKISLSSQLILFIAMFMLALIMLGGAWNIVQAVIFHPVADGLQQHWEWYLHGKATMILGCFAFAFAVDEPLERLLSRVF